MELTDENKARLFEALEADGVDNWENYQGQHYQEAIEAEEKLEENREKLEPLFEIITNSISHDYPAGVEAGAGYYLEEDNIVNGITKHYEAK